MPRQNSTNKSAYKKHSYSGPRKNRKRVLAGLRKRATSSDDDDRSTSVLSRDVWRKEDDKIRPQRHDTQSSDQAVAGPSTTCRGKSEDPPANFGNLLHQEVSSYKEEMSEVIMKFECDEDSNDEPPYLLSPSSARQERTAQVEEQAPSSADSRDRSRSPIEPYSSESNQALGVAVTLGGTVTLTGQVVPVHRTPHGHVRKRPNSPSIFASIEEKVEAMDLTDEEEDDAQVERWIYGPGLATPLPSNLSTAAAVNICEVSVDDSASLSLPIATLTTTKQPGSITNVSSADDVRPSCSGVTRTSKPVPKIRARNNSDLDSEYDEEYDFTKTFQTTVVDGIGREIPDDDELEEPVRKIISAVEEAMDEFAESLLSDSNTFIWEKNFESFRGMPEQFSGPTPGPLNNYETPYDAFSDIWTRDIIERIAEETNRYAQQTIDAMKAHKSLGEKSRVHQWHNTDADEIMILFAVYILLGIDTRTSQKEYWTSCGFLTLPYLKNLMTYNRYILLSKFLHFVDNSDVSQDYLQYEDTSLSPKLAKIAPVISHLNTKFSSLYNCCREISIDESLTLFKGRLSWVQAIRSKAARFGIKSYELCESQTGYLYKFQIYTGKNSGCDDVAPSVSLGGKSAQVVLELLKGLENRGHSVTMDNFYNSPSLARYLKSQGFDCLGTLRVNRKNVPEDIAKVPKNVAKGTIVARHCGDVSVLAWKDSKVVTMISTYHKDDTLEGSKAGRALVKPVSVDDYNRTMGGVDLKDQKLSMYLLERKRGVKLYMKIFKRLLNVSIHNAFILHLSSLIRVGKPKITHRDFRYELANSIVEHNRPALLQISEPDGKVMRLRRDIVHVPQYEPGSKTRKLCVVHQRLERKLVKTKCVTCDVFLCFEGCWEQWHSLAKLPGREVRGRKRKRDE